MIKSVVLGFIRVYQKTVSLDHGPLKILHPHGFCRFHPTCSEYGYQAIAKFGTIRGLYLAMHRIFRCHPWSKGGDDPIPTH